MRVFFLLVFVCFIFSSCGKQGSCIHKPDEIGTVTHNLEKFNNVSINSVFDVTLVDTNYYSISITTHKNIIPFIEYKIKDGELIVDNTSKCLWLIKTDKPKIVISTPKLDYLNVHNACDIKSLDSLTYDSLNIVLWSGISTTDLVFNCKDLRFKANSTTGDYRLSGKCFYSFLANIGSGYLRAEELQCQYMDFVHSSLGNTFLNVSNSISIGYIKYGNVFLLSENCPGIYYEDESVKERLFSGDCKHNE